MDIPLKDVPVGRFFATADPPPGNVYILRQSPSWVYVGRPVKGQRRRRLHLPGLCQNISDETYWAIWGHVHVRLIREDEHDQTEFFVRDSNVLVTT